jgi:S1-C subfamily serine protease
METKIKIKHQTGTKNGQIEEFNVSAGELRTGRGSHCQIRYDPDIDDMVSREHAIITIDGKETDTYWIEDRNSSNGLFVNGKQVWGKVKIYAGDTVQLGSGGPTFIFDLDPRPESHIKKTQVVDITPLKATKQNDIIPDSEKAAGPVSDLENPVIQTVEPKKQSVGRETVQRMVLEERKKTKLSTLLVAAGVIVLIVALGGYLYKTVDSSGRETGSQFGEMEGKLELLKDSLDVKTRPGAKTPAQIAAENSDKVVLIERAWKLIYTPTGEDLVHRFVTTAIQGQQMHVGVFVRTQQGFEPMLITRSADPNGQNEPIRGAGTGSGFVVASDGFILTNRHVAAPWFTTYNFPSNTFPGVLTGEDGKIIPDAYVTEDMVRSWVPANAMNINNRNASKVVEGTNMYMDVTFARNDLRVPAKVVRISNKHDVSMIKIDLPKVLPVVEMYDNYRDIKTGDVVTVLGYPGVSPDQYSQIKSHDYFNSNPQIVSVPVPTLSQGNIGRLIKGSTETASGNYYSSFGDSYQLTINSTGPGNSGGPLFNDQGYVIGLFNAGNSVITFAVPIRYGLELMGTDPVIDSK